MGLAVGVRFDFQGDATKKGSTKVNIPLGFSITAMTEFAQGMAQLIANLSLARITRVGLCIGLDLSGATLLPSPELDSDVTDKGSWGFDTAALGFYKKMFIPCLDEAKVASGSDQIDLLDADVAAFNAAMTSGIVVTGGTISPTDWRGNDVTGVRYAKEQFRRRNI